MEKPNVSLFFGLLLMLIATRVHGAEPTYHTIRVAGQDIFYREAGPADAPVLLLLHGFPSSSRVHQSLLESVLSAKYYLIASDYPGFGHSSWPAPGDFTYTFDHLAEVMQAFADGLHLDRYSLYLQDYGGPPPGRARCGGSPPGGRALCDGRGRWRDHRFDGSFSG